MRILIAEDTEDSRIFLKEYLEGVGYDIIAVENGKQAYQVAQSDQVDLVITDVLMPEMDGFSLCKCLKSQDNTHNIPIIFYTATYTDEQDRQLAMSLGASLFLVKPFEPDVLLGEIQRVIQQSYNMGSDPELETTNANSEYVQVLTKKLDKKIKDLESEKIDTEKLRRQIGAVNDSLPVLISELDSELRYLYVNQAYEKWCEIKSEHIIGTNVRELLGKAAFEKIEPFLRKALTGEKVFYETELQYLNGEVRFIQAQYIPNINKSREVVGIFVIVSDLTEKHIADLEREKLQQRLRQGQKLELIGQLTGGIAHDFNNILGIINGFSDLAMVQLQKQDNPALNKYMTEIGAAGQRGADLVAQLLSFSRKSNESSSIVGVNQSVRELAALLKPAIPNTVTLDIKAFPEELFVNINPVQLDQIIMNLCINAKDAIGGRGEVHLETQPVSKYKSACTSCLQEITGDFVAIAVADQGEGIDEYKLQRVFEPFFTTKKQGEGTGLGLAITHSIVHDFGGHIMVSSEPGEGSVITVLLPAQHAPNPTNKEKANSL